MIFGASSDVGNVRKENEDSFYIPALNDNLNLFLIADGIGGQGHGKLASMMTVDEILKYVTKNNDNVCEKESLLKAAVSYANENVKRFSEENSQFSGMGTTLVAMLIANNEAYIANAGDSRCYVIRKGIISQLTIDNSYVQYLLQKGAITQEEAQCHPQRNLITKAIGMQDDIDVDIDCVKLYPRDILLLCTDGLTTMLSDEDILHIILKKNGDMQSVAEELVIRAKDNGGTDNITAILVEV